MNDSFGPGLAARLIGPLALTPIDVDDGYRVVVELGSRGTARIQTRDDGQAWVQFSSDILFEDLRTHFHEARTSRRANKCIYCGLADEQLSREHIIPEGLNGEFTLIAASCKRCRDITSRIEQDVLQNAFGPARIALDMRTRRSDNRPSHLPMRLRRGTEEVEIQIPVGEFPAILPFPVFAPPGCLSGRPYAAGIHIEGTTHTQIAGLPLTELRRKYGGDYLGMRVVFEPVKFARAIAKMAYGFAVLQLGLDRISERYVLPAILGDATDVGRWVGCDPTPPMGPSTGLHAVTLRMEGKQIHVLVRLFAQFGAPEYHVVVGGIR